MSKRTDFLSRQRDGIRTRLEALRQVREDYQVGVKAGIRSKKELAAIDRKIAAAANELEQAEVVLAKAQEQEGLYQQEQQVEAKRLAEIAALQSYIEYYALTLATEEARMLWCAARSAVPGDVNMPVMSDEACAEWAADRLVELSGTVEIEELELAEADLA